MKAQITTVEEFHTEHDSILAFAENTLLSALNKVAIYAAFPEPELKTKDYIDLQAIAETWDFIDNLRKVGGFNLDHSNLNLETIVDPRQRQMAKFLFVDNDPAELAVQFDRVMQYALFQCSIGCDGKDDNEAMRKFLQMIQTVQAVNP